MNILRSASADRALGLRPLGRLSILLSMFLVTEADADAIRAVFEREGELSAAIEIRRRFPSITDNAKARAYARTIAGWKPITEPPTATVTRLRPRVVPPTGDI
ncbi:MAG TPA: hypothetical protein VGM32_04310 [Rhodopila sp.]